MGSGDGAVKTFDASDDQDLLGAGDAGIVRILDGDGRHVGMGFLVRPTMAVTCAHVVNLALGRDAASTGQPQADNHVTVVFPIVRGQPQTRAVVERWSAPGHSPVDDICVLRLCDPAPPDAGIAILADIRRIPLGRDPLSVFGYPLGHDIGRHIEARFMSRANAAWVQIDGASGTGAFVEPGFSGGAVWNQTHECGVGMVVARQEDPAIRIAYMLGAAQILRFAPEVPGERRDLSASFPSLWTIGGSLLSVALLFHFLATQYGEFPAALSFGFGNKALAGFWGLHIAAFLLPPFLWMQATFARGFREHPWWMRVPGFGTLGSTPRPTRLRSTAVASLVLLTWWPFWELGHFARSLHTRGDVYLYRSAFTEDYQDIEARFPGTYCDMPSVHYCTHPEAGLYSLARTGVRADQSYWSNMYHYGDRTGANRASVTVFPILQPAILMLLTGLCAFLGAMTTWLVFRPSRRTQSPATPAIR